MKTTLAAILMILMATSSRAADPLPEMRDSNIEYASPRAAYEALRKKPGVDFSLDDSGWTVAFDKSSAVIWSFSPKTDPAFPTVVKRTSFERQGQLFIAMDVICGASKEACDAMVRRYTEINEQAGRDARKAKGGGDR